MTQYLQTKQNNLETSNLVIYHVNDADEVEEEKEFLINNVRIFVNAIVRHKPSEESTQQAFYLINVVNGSTNPMWQLLPTEQENVAVVGWNHASSDLDTFFRTLNWLGPSHIALFSSIIFVSQVMRGPLGKQARGEWISVYRELLDNNNVGLVGPTVGCSQDGGTPYIHVDAFAMRTALVRPLLSEFNGLLNASRYISAYDYFGTRMSRAVEDAGYNISSVLYFNRLGHRFYQGTGPGSGCFDGTNFAFLPTGYSEETWCSVHPHDLLFLKLNSAAPFRSQLCHSKNSRHQHLDLSVTLMTAMDLQEQQGNGNSSDGARICFLVRIGKALDSHQLHIESNRRHEFTKVEQFVRALQRQTNPHWSALFFPTVHHQILDWKMQELLLSFMDSRLSFLSVASEETHKTPALAAFSAMDAALRHMHVNSPCRYVSLTNAESVHGEGVVERISKIAQSANPTAMILNPLVYQVFNFVDYSARSSRFDDRSELSAAAAAASSSSVVKSDISSFSFSSSLTVRPAPSAGTSDLSAIFFDYQRFLSEHIFFENFTLEEHRQCQGCLDNHLVQYLVRRQGWDYVRLSDSVAAHKISTTSILHMSAGSAFSDHPALSHCGCSHERTERVLKNYGSANEGTVYPNFDWRVYLALNPDLPANGVITEQDALVHFHSYGIVEKRRYSEFEPRPLANFDWKMYLKLNPDLNPKEVSTEKQARFHYYHFGMHEGRSYRKATTIPRACTHVRSEDEVTWKDYLEANPDLAMAGVLTEHDALLHYCVFGRKEGREKTKSVPSMDDVNALSDKMQTFISFLKDKQVPVEKWNLVFYHLGNPHDSGSVKEVVDNNVKLFLSAMKNHAPSGDRSQQHAFYILNVVGGSNNAHWSTIPKDLQNVAVLSWARTAGPLDSHIRTLQLIGHYVAAQFSTCFFGGHQVRGPLRGRKNGEWLDEFRHLLDDNNVGLVSNTMGCSEKQAIVHVHSFMIRSTLLPKAMQLYEDIRERMHTFDSVGRVFEHRLTEVVAAEGFKMASLLYQKRLGQAFFDGICVDHDQQATLPFGWTKDKWCQVTLEEVSWMRLGGESLVDNAPGYICGQQLSIPRLYRLPGEKKDPTELHMWSVSSWYKLHDTMKQIASEEPELGLVVPEVFVGGTLYELYKDYLEEALVPRTETPDTGSGYTQPKVCFIVRATNDQDPEYRRTFSLGIEDTNDLTATISSLLHQTNPHWRAYVFSTKKGSFETRLKEILTPYADPQRLKVIHIPDIMRLQFLPDETSFNATDYILNQVKLESDCRWLSISAGNIVYGSEVVAMVHGVGVTSLVQEHVSSSEEEEEVLINREVSLPPQLVLVPLDSKQFHHNNIIAKQGMLKKWNKVKCVSFEAMMKMNLLGYTDKPVPQVRQVDVASAFFLREKFVEAKISLGTFNHARMSIGCVACQDSLLTEYVVQVANWTFTQLPVEGLRGTVFRQPSPLHCVAAGNVWFDNEGCMKPTTIRTFYEREVLGLNETSEAISAENEDLRYKMDWDHFFSGDRICLRLKTEVNETAAVRLGKFPIY